MARLSKRTTDAVDIMVKMGHDPIEALVKLSRDERTPVSERARINMELAKYYAAMKRPVEVKPDTRINKYEFSWKGDKPKN